MPRLQIILAIAKRNFGSFFSGVLGYLFIIVFCVGGAMFAFSDAFFADNQTSLKHLTEGIPILLLFLIPAITMSVWSEERKLGTDELLFTLPATDVEILLGKYLAVLSTYSVALLCSTTHAIVLSFLGDPDIGLIISSYFGYWLAGAALLSAGMLASAFTSTAPVAFVLGVLFCCVPVFIDRLADVDNFIRNLIGADKASFEFTTYLKQLSISEQLRDLGTGVVSLSSICFFAGFTVLMLYLNLVVISRRRWMDSSRAAIGFHYAIRAIAILCIIIGLLIHSYFLPLRADVTEEQVFSLSDATKKVLDSLDPKRPIEIQAFISPEVPPDYVETRRQLQGLLREYDRRGGEAIQLREVSVEPFSNESEEARRFGVQEQIERWEQDGRIQQQEFYLGVVFSGSEEITVPFFGKSLPIEYELTRSVQTLAREARLTVGILQTDADIGGSRGGPEWQIVRELKKQYNVRLIDPDKPIDPQTPEDEDEDESDPPANKKDQKPIDMLFAVMPSSLTAPQYENFIEYARSGRPLLVFDDPVPLQFASRGETLTMAPRLPKPSPGAGNPFMQQQQPPPEPKAEDGKLTTLLNMMDVTWDNGRIVFDEMNPHDDILRIPPEIVFISESANRNGAFSSESPITRDLKEVALLYSGTLQAPSEKNKNIEAIEFTPLLITGGNSGLLDWDDFTEQGFDPRTFSQATNIKRRIVRKTDDAAHVVAAHVVSSDETKPLNIVFVADIDMISDMFFDIRNQSGDELNFDNVSFVLNAVDVLAGEESFVTLRSRRVEPRTLAYLEERTKRFIDARAKQREAAEKSLEEELKKAQSEFDDRIAELREDKSLDDQARAIQIAQLQNTVTRKLSVQTARLERERDAAVRAADLETRNEVKRVENWVAILAYSLPVLLPLSLALLVLSLRRIGESQSITPERRRRMA